VVWSGRYLDVREPLQIADLLRLGFSLRLVTNWMDRFIHTTGATHREPTRAPALPSSPIQGRLDDLHIAAALRAEQEPIRNQHDRRWHSYHPTEQQQASQRPEDPKHANLRRPPQ
jgi:hypothetical protein